MKKLTIVLLAVLMLLAVSCENEPQHEHKFSEEWKSNETQHWHECECKEKSGAADHDFETITVKATCTEKGSVTEKCKVCGFVKNTKELDKLEHTASDPVVTEATCSKEGSSVVKCSVCGEVISSKSIDKLEHTPDDPEVVEASCSKEGSIVVKCSVCGEVLSSNTIDKLDHTPSPNHVIVPSTCSEYGSDTIVCSECESIISTTYTEKAEHADSEEKVIKKPTCTEEGLQGKECPKCHEVISSTPIPPDGHSFGAWSDPDVNGQKTRECSVCHEKQTVSNAEPPANIMSQAIAFDNWLMDLGDKVVSITTFPDATILLEESGKLYDIQNVSYDNVNDTYSFDIKESDEPNYLSYVLGFEGKRMVVKTIDGVSPVDYDIEKDEYLMGFAALMMSEPPHTTHTYIKDAEYIYSDEVTYIVNFDAVYDSSKAYETRYLKITNQTDDSIVLEYTMNMKGPEAKALPIFFMKDLSLISYCNAVKSFTFDRVSYGLDDVNFYLGKAFEQQKP